MAAADPLKFAAPVASPQVSGRHVPEPQTRRRRLSATLQNAAQALETRLTLIVRGAKGPDLAPEDVPEGMAVEDLWRKHSQHNNAKQPLEHYVLGKTIGKGGFCKVKRATHKLTGVEVAVKIFDKLKLQTEMEEEMDVVMERLYREIHIMHSLDHNDHIIKTYEVIEFPHHVFVPMELAAGGELFDFIIAHGHLDETEACGLIHQILACIEYCHNHGIVHRDIKPENLLLNKQHRVKLVDFGLAQEWEVGMQLPGLEHGGSAAYLAPEVIIDDPEVPIGPPLDMWALGVIAYTLLTGTLPFVGDDVENEHGEVEEDLSSLFAKIVQGAFAMPAYISNEGKKLLAGLLDPDPFHRWTPRMVRRSAWYKRFQDPEDEMGTAERDDEAIDDAVLERVVNYGMDPAQIRRSLDARTLDPFAASYRLAVEKSVQEAARKRRFPRLHFPSRRKSKSTAPAPAPAAAADPVALPPVNAPPAEEARAAEPVPEPEAAVAEPAAEAEQPPDEGEGEGEGEPDGEQQQDEDTLADLDALPKMRVRHGVKARQSRRSSISQANLDNPAEALAGIEQYLKASGVRYERIGQLRLSCVQGDIEFELRIARDVRDDGTLGSHNLRLQRLQGDLWEYSKLARALLEACRGVLHLHHIDDPSGLSEAADDAGGGEGESPWSAAVGAAVGAAVSPVAE